MYDKFGLHKSGTKLLKCYEVELKKLKERWEKGNQT